MIRDLRPEDLPAMLEIYNEVIRNTTISLELDPVTLKDYAARLTRITQSYPCRVLEEEGDVLGFAYLDAFNPRAGYRCTADLTIYLAEGARGRGLGGTLYEALEKECPALGIRNLVAIVTGENQRSLRFHEKMGFAVAARFPEVAEKFGRRIGVVYMIKRLGE